MAGRMRQPVLAMNVANVNFRLVERRNCEIYSAKWETDVMNEFGANCNRFDRN